MEEKRLEKKVLEVGTLLDQDNRMMRRANDVKRAHTGRQPNFSFPFLFFILYLLHVVRIVACDHD